MKAHQNEMQDLSDATYLLLRALSFCHYKIVEGKTDIFGEAGTTTLLGGMLLRIKDKEKSEKKDPKDEPKKETFIFICVSIGDCKVFHYVPSTRKATDITLGNRRNAYDAKDCGGRLGPYVGENGDPDIRNVTIYHQICAEDDLIILCSDGVHDNMDPQTLGIGPKDLSPQYASWNSWDQFPSEQEADLVKSEFMIKYFMEEAIDAKNDEEKLRNKVFSFTEENDDRYSPDSITSRAVKHCLKVTSKSREWMEQNPKEKLPMDYVEFPGKMDHATCVAIRVTRFDRELAKAKEALKSSEKRRTLPRDGVRHQT